MESRAQDVPGDLTWDLTEVWQGVRQRATSLRRYLMEEALLADERQERYRRGHTTATEVQRYQERVRAHFLREVMGAWPERVDLAPRSVGVIERDGYRIEKLVMQTQPDFWLTAHLYLPDEGVHPRPPNGYPGVLVPLGHAPAAKLFPDYQRFGALLARNGMVALLFDPLGQGERGEYLDPNSGNNHFVVGNLCHLFGQNLMRYILWDAIRALDYLEARPEVDKARLGVSGSSGGGSQSLCLAAVDERVRAVVPVDSMVPTLFTLSLVHGAGHHPEDNFVGALDLEGCTFEALMACVAPRPMLVVGGLPDTTFPPDEVEIAFLRAAGVYRALSRPDHIHLEFDQDDHGFQRGKRALAASWLKRWLSRDGDDRHLIPERETEALIAEREGQCTSTGNVEALGSVTVRDLLLRTAGTIGRSQVDGAATLREILGLPDPPWAPFGATVANRDAPRPVAVGGLRLWATALEYPVQPGRTAGALALSISKAPASTCLVVDARPTLPAQLPRMWASWLEAGRTLVVPCSPQKAPPELGLMLRRPILGLRVLDLVALADAVERLVGENPRLLGCFGPGPSALIGVWAALFEPRYQFVVAHRAVTSWTDLLHLRLPAGRYTAFDPEIEHLHGLGRVEFDSVTKEPLADRLAWHTSEIFDSPDVFELLHSHAGNRSDGE